jgi:DNA repair protein RadC
VNLSVLPEQALVNELLACTPMPPHAALSSGPTVLHACDGECPDAANDARGLQLAHLLGVAKELLLRRLRRDLAAESFIGSPDALRDWLRLYCAELQYEVFVVLFLDAQSRVIDVEPMFRGTVTQTAVYPREVVKAALARNATAVAFAHNHPSGSAEPSRSDGLLTANLKSALALVDVRVVDHVIVAGDQTVSMAQRGLL